MTRIKIIATTTELEGKGVILGGEYEADYFLGDPRIDDDDSKMYFSIGNILCFVTPANYQVV